MRRRRLQRIHAALSRPRGKEHNPETIKNAINDLLEYYDASELMEFKQHIELLIKQKTNEKTKD